MKRNTIFPLLFWIALTLAWATPGFAASETWEFDRAHSSVNFDVRHIYAVIRGNFEDFSGAFAFDPDAPETGRCDVTVQVKSINTRIGKRDDHLRGKDFFDAGRFPTMRFQSDRVVGTADGGQFALEGKLTIKDVTRNVTIPFTFFGVRENPLNDKQMVAGFEARFEIDRLDYHVGSGKYYEMGVVDKNVTVTISLEMVRDR